MKNNNYFQSRELCSNLCNIFGLSRHLTHSFTRIIAQGIVHQVAESALDHEDSRLNNFSIEIPFIGRADIEIINNNPIVKNMTLEPEFSRWILEAVQTGNSPLVVDAEKALVESIKSRYESLL